ncbi:MAG: hypothetical protein EP319_15180 [Deltaproteobacteria bacterium]|nr:MAG: hypothetical protein EP319_15180 [Deltaproteobacteria bacterium]
MKALKLHYFVAALLVVVGMNTASAQRHGDHRGYRYGQQDERRASRLASDIEFDSRSIVDTLRPGRGGGYGSTTGGWDTGRGRHGGGHGPGFGGPAAEAIRNVAEMAREARQLTTSLDSYRSSIESTRYQFSSLQRAHQQAELTKYQIRRAHLVSHLFSNIQRNMSELARLYMQRPGRGDLVHVANRLDQVTSRLKDDIRMDVGRRRHITFEERQLLMAADRLEMDADQFKRVVDMTNGQGRGPRVRQAHDQLERSLRELRQAARRNVLSYTAEEKLQRVKKLVDQAADILGVVDHGRGGRGGRDSGRNDFDIF